MGTVLQSLGDRCVAEFGGDSSSGLNVTGACTIHRSFDLVGNDGDFVALVTVRATQSRVGALLIGVVFDTAGKETDFAGSSIQSAQPAEAMARKTVFGVGGESGFSMQRLPRGRRGSKRKQQSECQTQASMAVRPLGSVCYFNRLSINSHGRHCTVPFRGAAKQG